MQIKGCHIKSSPARGMWIEIKSLVQWAAYKEVIPRTGDVD